jgi:hypothetical protein
MLAEPGGSAQGQGPTAPSVPQKSWGRHPLLSVLLALVILFLGPARVQRLTLRHDAVERGHHLYHIVAQVTANNVESVTITEYSITGVAKTVVTSHGGKVHSTQFTTTVPQFGNDTLIPLLQQHHVSIAVESSNSGAVNFWVNLILLSTVLCGAVLRWMQGDPDSVICEAVGRFKTPRLTDLRAGYYKLACERSRMEVCTVLEFVREILAAFL